MIAVVLLTIVCPVLTNVHGSRVRDIGRIIYRHFWGVKQFRENKSKGKLQTQYNQSYHSLRNTLP